MYRERTPDRTGLEPALAYVNRRKQAVWVTEMDKQDHQAVERGQMDRVSARRRSRERRARSRMPRRRSRVGRSSGGYSGSPRRTPRLGRKPRERAAQHSHMSPPTETGYGWKNGL